MQLSKKDFEISKKYLEINLIFVKSETTKKVYQYLETILNNTPESTEIEPVKDLETNPAKPNFSYRNIIIKELQAAGGKLNIDEIQQKTDLSISDCLVNLLELEFQGKVKQLPGKVFELIAEIQNKALKASSVINKIIKDKPGKVSKTKIKKRVMAEITQHNGLKQFDYTVLQKIQKYNKVEKDEFSNMFHSTLDTLEETGFIEYQPINREIIGDIEGYILTESGEQALKQFDSRYNTLYNIATGADMFNPF